MDRLNRIKELVAELNKAGEAYYQENKEIIPNIEYDKLYDELVSLEEETGIVLSNSPTAHVGYEIMGNLPKEKHEFPMLSLDKTKDVDVLASWLKDKSGMLSWKLDGLTIVLTYKEGKLEKAITRGNGITGEVITNNAKVFANLPLKIDYKGELVLRGEAVIKYSDFERINNEIPGIDAKYKNPRNLCSGTVRQLNNKIAFERRVNFYAFALVKAEGVNFNNSRINQIEWLRERGFETVGYKNVCSGSMTEVVSWFGENIEKNDLPSDGLVLIYDDINYGQGLGATSKFPRDAIAFKWKDEVKETKLEAIEWSASRTGLINPIAIFQPVELEGTTVSRASLHNISIMKELKLGIGDIIKVYKANMIIPQVQDNMTKSNNLEILKFCPVCDARLDMKNEKGVETLLCPNENCLAKQIKGFTHFVARDAMNMEGLSEATIEKLISKKLIKELADLFHVEKFKEEISTMDGFGEKSFKNLVASVNMARKTSHAKFLYSLGIPNIGVTNAKVICKAMDYNWEKIESLTFEELQDIDGVGPIMAEAFTAYFTKPENRIIVADLLKEIEFEEIEGSSEAQIFASMNFVITGSLTSFENREKLKNFIEDRGGKVTDSVTGKTNYLINNDNLSSSSKNKKAKELGIKIITEEEFLNEVYNA